MGTCAVPGYPDAAAKSCRQKKVCLPDSAGAGSRHVCQAGGAGGAEAIRPEGAEHQVPRPRLCPALPD
jgi:hypothetical protein